MASSQEKITTDDDKDDIEDKMQFSNIDLCDLSQYGETEPSNICECGREVCEVIKSFCSHTSLHGIQYVGEKGYVAIRLLWASVVILAFGGAIYHICQVYNKWEETPATVTISPTVKDIQDIYFPAVTFCVPPILLTKKFVRTFLNETGDRYNQRKRIVDSYCENGPTPCDGTREDCETFRKNVRLSCNAIMEEAKYSNGGGTWKRVVPDHVIPSQTLLRGHVLHCCTFNGLTDDLMYKNLNITRNKKANTFGDYNTKSTKSQDILTPTGIGTQNAFSYEKSELYCIEKGAFFWVSIHHPAEAPNVHGDGLIVKPGSEVSYTVKPLQTESTDSLKHLNPKKRECQYYDDVQLKYFRNYTQWNCNLDCLANLTIATCRCLPPYLPENNGTLKLCKETACFFKLHDEFERNGHESCKCEQACDDVTYVVTTQYIPAETEDNNTLKFDVYFTESTFFSYLRSENLGVTDFLASCGGLLGLFMGFSFISMIEIFYFGIFGMWKSVFGRFSMKVSDSN